MRRGLRLQTGARSQRKKWRKSTAKFTLELIPTRDILASLPHERSQFLVVGFAAETHDLEANAQRKLREKNCDMIVANDVSRNDSGMESDDNAVTIFFRDGEIEKNFARIEKNYRARNFENIFKLCEKSLTKKS